MSVLEVIEQIKALPPEEQARVVEFLHRLEAPQGSPHAIQYVDRPTLEKSAEQVFDCHDELFRKLAQ